MEQILKIKCWKCSQVFNMRAEVAAEPSPNLVETVLPCPYCETDNQVIIREDQVKAAVLFRKARDSTAAESAGPLPDIEYYGAPPGKDSAGI